MGSVSFNEDDDLESVSSGDSDYDEGEKTADSFQNLA